MIKPKTRHPVWNIILIIMVAAVGFSACQTMPDLSGVGRVVPPENRIPLAHDCTDKGQWTGDEVTLHYQYERRGEHFTIIGKIDFSSPLQTGFKTLDHFFLEMVFTDRDGVVVAFRPLLSVGYGRRIDRIPFKRNITVPPDAVAMAFGFRGRARDAGSDADSGSVDSIEWDFQKTPF